VRPGRNACHGLHIVIHELKPLPKVDDGSKVRQQVGYPAGYAVGCNSRLWQPVADNDKKYVVLEQSSVRASICRIFQKCLYRLFHVLQIVLVIANFVRAGSTEYKILNISVISLPTMGFPVCILAKCRYRE